jgi:fatty acid/phospholipid biosynthesis enzyme
MRIAVDAMGTDTYPIPDVEGAILLPRICDTIIMVGDQDHIKRRLKLTHNGK